MYLNNGSEWKMDGICELKRNQTKRIELKSQNLENCIELWLNLKDIICYLTLTKT